MLRHFRSFARLVPSSSLSAAPVFGFANTESGGTKKKSKDQEKNEVSTSSSSDDDVAKKRTQRPKTHLKNVALVLSGSGVQDGSEITEAVSFLISFGSRKIKHQCFAPNKNQTDVIDHLTGEKLNETRNVLVESARIARGQVKDLKELDQAAYDAVFFPGGFGAAKNLSDFATNNEKLTVDSEVERVLKDFHTNQKPIGLACISPVLAAKVFGAEHKASVTVGSKGEGWPYGDTIDAIEKLGAKHVAKTSTRPYSDAKNRIFSTPAFMKETNNFHEVYSSVDNLVDLVERNLATSKVKDAAKKEAKKTRKADARKKKAERKAAKNEENPDKEEN